MMKKERVDVLAVQQGLFDNVDQAKRSVMAGLVLTEKHERLDKPGEKIPITTQLEIKGKKKPLRFKRWTEVSEGDERFWLRF